MLSVTAETKLMAIAKWIGQWEEDHRSDEHNIKMWRTLSEKKPEKLKQYEASLPDRLKQQQMTREQAKYGQPDIMTTIKQMRELCDMVLPQHTAASPAPQIVKQS